jgi:hypothetical protein
MSRAAGSCRLVHAVPPLLRIAGYYRSPQRRNGQPRQLRIASQATAVGRGALCPSECRSPFRDVSCQPAAPVVRSGWRRGWLKVGSCGVLADGGATTRRTATWLFAGARGGSHLDRGRLSKLLNKEFVFIHPARGAALSALPADLPAPVLAELLGLSISSAMRWVAHTARDEADYLAARITNPPTRPDGLEPVRG